MPKHTCPVCGALFRYDTLADYPTFPFCSKRCRLIDLGAWFAEDHQIVESARAGGLGEEPADEADAAIDSTDTEVERYYYGDDEEAGYAYDSDDDEEDEAP